MAESEVLAEAARLEREGKAQDVTTELDSLLSVYQALDWPVFPIRARDKTPLTPNGFKDASTDWATIEKWRAQYPDCNWGLSVGDANLLVVDLDGPTGLQSWKAFGRLYPHVPTLTCKTGGGGFHFYYHDDSGLPNSASKIGEKVDTRGRGGYVLVPPSIHPSGAPYSWFVHPQSGDTWAYVQDGRPPDVPSWILPALAPPAPPPRPSHSPPPDDSRWASRLDGFRLAVAHAPEGQRNMVLNWAIYTGAHDAGIPLDILEILKAEALAAGLEQREVEATWKSATARAQR